MYQVESSAQSLRNKPAALANVGRMVIALGITSFFTDISAEMVNATLPIFLTTVLRLAPFQLGLVDGIYHGAAVLVRLVSGVWADRTGRRKEAAVAGYSLSALSKLGLLFLGSAGWGGVIGITILDRIGKGIRTSPRDAMIAASVPKEKLATAFGVHRAMDTAGAMLGPLIASLLLWLTSAAYDAVFVVSLCFGLIGVAVLVMFVRNPSPADASATSAPVSMQPHYRFADGLKLLIEPRFRRLVMAGALLSLVTVSDNLLHLNLLRKINLAPGLFPLLYVFVALVYMLFAIPIGRLADRFGRGRLLMLGYIFLGVVYSLLLWPWQTSAMSGAIHTALLAGYVLLLGLYYASTEGILIALASGLLPEHVRTTGLAVLTSATGLARLLASVLFGLIWTWAGGDLALIFYLGGLVLALWVAAYAFRQNA
jgi:MFS family permease